MRMIFTLVVLVFGLGQLLAQQTPQYTMYMLNPYGINPAYAGLDQSISATGVYRRQWDNFDFAPSSQHFNIHSPSYFLGGGIGLAVENERFGAEQHFSALLGYAYHLVLPSRNILSIGISGGVVQKTINGQDIRTPEGNYEGITIDHNDLLLPNSRVSALGPVFNVGIYYQGESLEVGLNVDQVSEQTIDFDLFSYQLRRAYGLYMAYGMDIGRKLRLTPSVLVKSIISQTQIDFSARMQYNDNLFGGVSVRGYNDTSLDAVALLAGFRLTDNITVAYSYDITLSDLREVSTGSHEVMVHYNLGKPVNKGKLPPIIYNPRFR